MRSAAARYACSVALLLSMCVALGACGDGSVPPRPDDVPKQQAGSARYSPTGEFLNWSKAPLQRPARSRDGVPLVQQEGRWVPNPVTTAQYGLAAFGHWANTRDPAMLRIARRQADWLLDNQDRRSGEWRYGFSFPVNGMSADVVMRPGWTSAMAQGQAMSLLTRVYRETGDRRYLDAAVRALRPLRKSVADGGQTASFKGHPFFEEYPTRPASFTLNGFMFTLLGLYDLSRSAPGSDAGRQFRDGMKTLKVALPYYDTGGGLSAYHLGYLTDGQPKLQSSFYHWMHVRELTALDSIAPDPAIKKWRDAWAAYKPQPGDPK